MRINDFDSLYNRMNIISERKSPYAGSHPSFGDITSKMRASGLSSAPLDTIKFIRETLYHLDIINDEELSSIKRAPGFSGKKTAMLAILKSKQAEINSKADEIAKRVEETLDNFISGVGVDRGSEEKYAAQSGAHEIEKQMKKVKAGKKMKDALDDIVSDESLLVKASVAKVLNGILEDLGEPGLDIDEEALAEVIGYSDNINTVEELKDFISQIAEEPGYEKIAAYLSSAVKPIIAGITNTSEDNEDIESYYDPTGGNEQDYDEVMRYDSSKESNVNFIEGETDTVWIGDDGEEVDGVVEYAARKNPITGKIDIKLTGGYITGNNPSARMSQDMIDYMIRDEYYSKDHIEAALADAEMQFYMKSEEGEESGYGDDSSEPVDVPMGESYTAKYMAGEKRVIIKEQPKLQTFKDRYKPKNIHQLVELSNYGFR